MQGNVASTFLGSSLLQDVHNAFDIMHTGQWKCHGVRMYLLARSSDLFYLKYLLLDYMKNIINDSNTI